MPELTLERVLKLALNMEEQSIEIYTSAQNKVSSSGSKVLLKELVKEEEKRKYKLEKEYDDVVLKWM